MAENKKWIAAVNAEMKKKGTVGSFTKQAKRAGMSVHDFAMKVKENPEDYSKKTHERAGLALTFEKMAKDRKYAAGGKTQGYNDKLDEDLGTRLGRERGYKQSLKDRRDESKAGNKTLGRRAYASVDTMDKGDRMFMHGGKTKMMHGGFTEDYTLKFKRDTDVRIIGEDGNVIDVENYKKGDQEKVDILSSDGKFLMVQFQDGYVGHINKEDVQDQMYMHGGKTQGYADEQDESLGMRTGAESTKKQSMKARRDDSYGKWGKRDMEDRDITMARGGSVKGKIDRDRYVKLRRDKDKEIAKLKKEKGALRKATITKEKCDDKIETRLEGESNAIKLKESSGDTNQTLLIGGVAGILFGAFLIGR